MTAEALSGITSYSYDAAGNRTQVEEPTGDITTNTWDAQNHLVQVELPTGDVVTYTWAPVNKSAEERIVERDDGTTVTRYLWDNNNVLRETDDVGAVEATYTYRPQPFGDLVAQHRDGDSAFYQFDALGSTTGLTDATGAVTDDYRYEAFGKVAASTGSTETPYQWVGQLGYRHDDSTSDYNLRNRQYDPQTGQFLSVDPLGLASGDNNFYRYVANSPVNLVDPSGLKVGNHVSSLGDRVFTENRVFLGRLLGEQVVMQHIDRSCTVSWSELATFSNRFWDTIPPGYSQPVRDWDGVQWRLWFCSVGGLQEGQFFPQTTTQKEILIAKQVEAERTEQLRRDAARRLSEELLAQATHEVVNLEVPVGLPAATVLMKDGSVRSVCRNIDPKCAADTDSGTGIVGGATPGQTNSQIDSLVQLTVTKEQLHQLIVARHRALLEEHSRGKLDLLEELKFRLDIIGLVPVVGEFGDLGSAAISAYQGNTVEGLVSLSGAIPFAGTLATTGKFVKQESRAIGKMALSLASESPSMCQSGKVGVHVKVLDDLSPTGKTTAGQGPSCSLATPGGFEGTQPLTGNGLAKPGVGGLNPDQLPLQPPKPTPAPHPDLVPVGPPEPCPFGGGQVGILGELPRLRYWAGGVGRSVTS